MNPMVRIVNPDSMFYGQVGECVCLTSLGYAIVFRIEEFIFQRDEFQYL